MAETKTTKSTSIVTIAIQKGGAGKTTCAVNLASSYGHLGYKVLLVDLDYQSNATELIGIDAKSLEYKKTICYAIEREAKFSDFVIETKVENVSLLAASKKLFELSKAMHGKPNQSFLLHPLFDDPKLYEYDMVIIDTNPDPDPLFQSALTISNYYLVPVFPENDVIDGLATVFQNAEMIKKHLNSKLTLLGCVIQKFDKKSAGQIQNEKILRQISKESKIPILKNMIPFSRTVYSASNAHKPLLSYLKNSEIVQAYLALAGEIRPLLKGKRVGRAQATIAIDRTKYRGLLECEEAMAE